MMLIRRYFLLTLVAGLTLLFAAPASAAPLRTKHIPTRAEGVIHVDVDKLRNSSLWKLVEEQLPKPTKGASLSQRVVDTFKDMNEDGIKELLSILVADVHGITVWGVDDDEWAMVVDMPIVATLLPILEDSAGFKKSTKSGVTLYRWEKEAVISVHGNHLVVGTDAKSVVASARLLAGKGKSIGGKKLSGLSSTAKGIVVVAGFGGKLMKAISKEATSTMLKTDIRSLLFFAGEHAGRFFVQAEAVVDSSATASKLVTIVSGLQAVLALSGEEPELQELLSGLTVNAKGSSMSVRLEVPVKTVLDLAK